MELTERRDLRGGRSSWIADDKNKVASDALPDRTVDIVIIGAGVMGAMLAERLSADGREVVLLDRRPPAHGSTAASTALVMWAADVPLSQLAERIGLEEAARRWRRVYDTVGRLGERIAALGIQCNHAEQPELYLAGTLLEADALHVEEESRRRAGLPSIFHPADAIAERFGIAPRAALLSTGSYGVDPVELTLGLLAHARQRGARACFPVDIVVIERRDSLTHLRSTEGEEIAARHVVLATGYERATWFLPPAFSITSSYAIATPLGRAPLWRENALIWEASSPYIYTRSTAEGRVIAGGEDEDFADAYQRDVLIGAKSGTIRGKLAAMLNEEDIPIDCAWAAAFGSSPDGLPAVGRAEGQENLWLASGFGGNGVSFAALAAELIAADFAGRLDPDVGCFSPYRFDR